MDSNAPWTSLLRWSAAAAFAVVLFVAMRSGRPEGALLPDGPALAAVALAAAVPLGWAWRRPSVVLAVVLTEIVAGTALREPIERLWPLYVAAYILVGVIAATRSPRAAAVAAPVTVVVQEAAWHVQLWLGGGMHRVLAPGFLALTVLLAMTVAVAWIAGTALRQRHAYAEDLRAHAVAQAVTSERLRIARELHDMVAHSIGVIAIQAGAGGRVIDSRPDQARQALTTIETTSRETLRGLRHMLGALRRADPDPYETGPYPGLADLDRLTAATADAGVRVDVRRPGRRRPLPSAIDRSAYRIIQEAVTNVVRHAGTGRCQVSIDDRGGELRIEIVDAGRGGHPAGTGYGIAGMRERATLLRGDLSAGPRPGGGFRVAARLPVPPDGR